MSNFLDVLTRGTRRQKRVNPVNGTVVSAGLLKQHDLFVDSYSRSMRKSGELKSEEGVSARPKRVKVTGIECVPPRFESFSDCACLSLWVSKTMLSLGYTNPTDIQSQAIPIIKSGYDLIATAPTGSGKTLSFLLPILDVLERPDKKFGRAIVIDPTKELAQQTFREATNFIEKASRKFQVKLLDQKNCNSKRVDIVITTPLKFLAFLRSTPGLLSDCQVLVLDEADKLLDLGFQPQLDEILTFYKQEIELRRSFSSGEEISRKLQLCFVSATLPDNIVSLATSVMTAPAKVSVGLSSTACADVSQKLLFCGREDGKLLAFRQLISDGAIRPPTLVFVQSKERAVELCNELLFDGIMVDVIHADRTDTERGSVVKAFREGKVWVLISTDLLTRGIDFKGIEMVVNYDVPKTAATYIHRVGRAGRAGRKGECITLFTEEDKELMRPVVNVIRNGGNEVPQWLVDCLGKKNKRNNRNKRKTSEIEYFDNPKRKRIDTKSGFDRKNENKKKQIIEMSKSKRQRESA